MNPSNATPQVWLRANQYLYYVLGTPVYSDREYDLVCQRMGLDGSGGSDLDSSYTEQEKRYAQDLLNGNLPHFE